MPNESGTWGSFQTAVTTGGTAQQVTTGLAAEINSVRLEAMAANTAGALYLGGSGVSATTGYELVKGQTVFIDAVDSLAGLYFIGATTADRISVLWVGP
jgi:hypothetical protein